MDNVFIKVILHVQDLGLIIIIIYKIYIYVQIRIVTSKVNNIVTLGNMKSHPAGTDVDDRNETMITYICNTTVIPIQRRYHIYK